MWRTVLVATDGSGTAAAAVAHAVELAKRTGAELLVTTVYRTPQESQPPFAYSEAFPSIDVARGLLADVEKRYGGEAKLRTVIREGSPADEILTLAEQEGVDVIVVGNKGMSSAKRFVLGSVPNAVSHHAPCHVLIVHTTDE